MGVFVQRQLSAEIIKLTNRGWSREGLQLRVGEENNVQERRTDI